MAKKKVINSPVEVAYVPKLDTFIFVYIRKDIRRLNPIPYKWKPNYQYLIALINDQRRLHKY